MKFTVYRTDTGEIVKKGNCMPEDLALQAGEGEAVYQGHALNDTDWRIDLATLQPVSHTPQKSRDELIGEILKERERRFANGLNFEFGDARGTHRIGTTAADMAGWDDVTKLAAPYIAAGLSDTEIQIETDTGPATVTAAEWQRVLIAIGEFRQKIWSASFALQALDTIPQNVTDDQFWPAAG